MSTRSSRVARPLALAGSLALLATFAGTASAVPRRGYDVLEPACTGPPARGRAMCFAITARAVAIGAGRAAVLPAGAEPYTAGAGALSVGPAGGLTPADLAGAYSYDPSGGAGQTVGIVDAYDDPTIEADLKVFDEHYGLGECSHANGCFRKVNETGSETGLPVQDKTGWSAEIALDVETVRSACHACRIVLVEAASNNYKDLAPAVNTAVALGANEVTNSYGGPEAELSEGERKAYEHPGTVITAAAGDLGWDDFALALPPYDALPPGMPNAPASLPSVVAVGGTTLSVDEQGAWRGETVWDDESAEEGRLVTGGGCSTTFAAPPWQLGAAGFAAIGCGAKRLSADVAADGDPLSGFDVYDSFDYCKVSGAKCSAGKERSFTEHGGWQKYGGTSLSAPLITALYALAGGAHGLAYPAASLYGHLGDASALHDVTEGGNGWCHGEPAPQCGHPNIESGGLALDCEETAACDASTGLDGPTGVGTPNGLSAFTPALPVAAITPPARIVAGTSASFTAAASSDPNPGATIDRWTWDWGEGPESAGPAAAHVFAAPGEYPVKLAVADSYGLSGAETTTTVLVISPAQAEAEEREDQARRAAQAAGRGSSPPPTQGVSAFKQASPPRASLAAVTRVAVSRAGRFTLRLTCSPGSGSCVGTVFVRLLAGARSARSSVGALLSSARFRLAPGASATIVFDLVRQARSLLLARHTLRVRIVLGAHGSSTAGQIARLVLRAPSRRRRA